MAQRKVAFALGEYYHLYNRGNSKQEIFLSRGDYSRFLQQLYLANGTKKFNIREIEDEDIFKHDRGESLVHIGAYCLMPNHFHLLLTPAQENGVQIFMQKLSTGYSMYFNKRHERTGGLFEGRFKAQHANTDEYLKYLFAYIHLNPLKLIDASWKERGVSDAKPYIEYLKKYEHSSYLDYQANRPESVIVNKKAFPEYFDDSQTMNKDLFSWISYGRENA